MSEYCSINVNLNASAQMKSVIKYNVKIAAQDAACSPAVHSKSAKIMKPKHEASLSEIDLFAGGYVATIIEKQAAQIIMPRRPKKEGIAPISPKTDIPRAIVADCVPRVAPPRLVYLYR
ncbi:MAG: hypothetical protein J6T72_00215 [Alphaproteobacteria bacterium]|nr:hypothetical protein [Alphaproteobacteria bacterium]